MASQGDTTGLDTTDTDMIPMPYYWMGKFYEAVSSMSPSPLPPSSLDAQLAGLSAVDAFPVTSEGLEGIDYTTFAPAEVRHWT
jgi:hypothetical protein